MKKIVCLLVAIVFFSCDRQYDNFKITGINMHAVTFNDSIRSKKRYFLIDFTTVLCHPKSTLFGGGVEPGLKELTRASNLLIFIHVMVRLFPPILRGGTRIWKVQFQTEEVTILIYLLQILQSSLSL